MPFVKIDTGILDSTIWADQPAERVFLTALCMATPVELRAPTPQLAVRDMSETGFVVPAGWYGFVSSAGTGIVRRALMDEAVGLEALERLGAPDPASRSTAHDGRRLVRVDRGFVILNFMNYRERDYGSAERSKRYRQSLKTKRRRVARGTTPTRELVDRVREKVARQADEGPSRDDTA